MRDNDLKKKNSMDCDIFIVVNQKVIVFFCSMNYEIYYKFIFIEFDF